MSSLIASAWTLCLHFIHVAVANDPWHWTTRERPTTWEWKIFLSNNDSAEELEGLKISTNTVRYLLECVNVLRIISRCSWWTGGKETAGIGRDKFRAQIWRTVGDFYESNVCRTSLAGLASLESRRRVVRIRRHEIGSPECRRKRKLLLPWGRWFSLSCEWDRRLDLACWHPEASFFGAARKPCSRLSSRESADRGARGFRHRRQSNPENKKLISNFLVMGSLKVLRPDIRE